MRTDRLNAHRDRVLNRMRSADKDLTARQIAEDITSSRNYVAQTLDGLAREWFLTAKGGAR
jgi:DNA-binding IscR family transcriptional regulator